MVTPPVAFPTPHASGRRLRAASMLLALAAAPHPRKEDVTSMVTPPVAFPTPHASGRRLRAASMLLARRQVEPLPHLSTAGNCRC